MLPVRTPSHSPSEAIAATIGIPRSAWGKQRGSSTAANGNIEANAAEVAPLVAACYRSYHRFDHSGDYAIAAGDGMWDALMSHDPERSALSSWVTTVVTRRLTDRYRQLRRQGFPRPADLETEDAALQLSREPSPAGEAEHQETLCLVSGCLAQLAADVADSEREWESAWVAEISRHLTSGDTWPSPSEFADHADIRTADRKYVIMRCQKLAGRARKRLSEALTEAGLYW